VAIGTLLVEVNSKRLLTINSILGFFIDFR